MTHKAVLIVTNLLRNRDILQCLQYAKYVEDDEGYVSWIMFDSYKVRIYEKPDQTYGIIFRFEFHENNKLQFTVVDYLRNGSEHIVFAKKDVDAQSRRMENTIETIRSKLNELLRNVHPLTKWLACGK